LSAGAEPPAGQGLSYDHRIRKAFLLPLGLDTLLLFGLLLITLFVTGERLERLVMGLFFLLALVLFLEGAWRRVRIDAAGLAVRKLGRSKSVTWEEITHVGSLTLHKKVYLLLTTTRGYLVISNAYEGFAGLVEEIVARVAPDRVEEEVRLLAGRNGVGIAQIVSAWIAAALMIGIMVLKLVPLA
jgi:hypothetical protein